MGAQQVIDESLPMLDDMLGRIGIHRTGEAIDFARLSEPFSTWIQQQVVSQEDINFLSGLVGAFICEYFIHLSGARRRIDGRRILLTLPFQQGIAREFDPYAAAHGLVTKQGSLSEFLVMAGT
jgi:hypothetical protein